MSETDFVHAPLNVGFVSTRFNGTDGVSLETAKWVDILERMGHHCFYFAGDSDRPPEKVLLVPEAFFEHPTIQAINEIVFSDPRGTRDFSEMSYPGLHIPHLRSLSDYVRPPATTRRILELKQFLKEKLAVFAAQFDLHLIIVENALAIPMNIPLGLALTEFIAETGFPTIAHHHDFFWERKRFLVNCVGDYLSMAFPPTLPSIQHVAISPWAAGQLSLRTGIAPMIIPNVMDFDQPPPAPDGYLSSLRVSLGLAPDQLMVLQPTRVVQRKGIEHAIELVKRLNLDAKLIISNASGDEGDAYERRVREYAALLGVETNFVSEIIGSRRTTTADGRKVYTLEDVYPLANLVTYPSEIEGFGNAFLEAIYYRRPLVVNNYTIYAVDIKPKGFHVIEFDGFITDETVEQAEAVLKSPDLAGRMAEHNYNLARRYYSYAVLQRRLATLIAMCFGEE